MKRLGFETFTEVVDENYDNIESDSERLNAILNEVKKLSEKSLEEMDAIFKDMKEKLVNNHRKLINNVHYFDENVYPVDIFFTIDELFVMKVELDKFMSAVLGMSARLHQ